MDFKNWKLKKKQKKSMQIQDGYASFISLPYHCPKCIWGTDTIEAYIEHLENHLINTKKSKKGK